MKRFVTHLLIILLLGCCASVVLGVSYKWIERYEQADELLNRIPVPAGYERVAVQQASFGEWLRHIPLKKGTPPVYLYNGQKKYNQDAHFAVVAIDVGKDNLQQCADAVIRLRAEYLYSTGNHNAIAFDFTSGDEARFVQWAEGYRPRVTGNRVSWVQKANRDYSYQNFRRYLNTVFMYAGTYSLSRELHRVSSINELNIGDVFIQGGFPGHAVLVVDMAINRQSGKKVFLLAQSYMPAQEIHILKNPGNAELNPWYELDFGEQLNTPEWTFSRTHLKRW